MQQSLLCKNLDHSPICPKERIEDLLTTDYESRYNFALFGNYLLHHSQS